MTDVSTSVADERSKIPTKIVSGGNRAPHD